MTPPTTPATDPLEDARRDLWHGTLGGAVFATAACALWHEFGLPTDPLAYGLLWPLALAWGREIHLWAFVD